MAGCWLSGIVIASDARQSSHFSIELDCGVAGTLAPACPERLPQAGSRSAPHNDGSMLLKNKDKKSLSYTAKFWSISSQ